MASGAQPISKPHTCFEAGFRFGILGGGQLGKMLTQAAQTWHVHTAVLDPSPSAPARPLCNEFVTGSFHDPDAVLAFGKSLDVLTIEIESVHAGALEQLAASGVRVHPSPQALTCIQDKGDQKAFLASHGLPTSAFRCFADRAEVLREIESGGLQPPFVQKLRRSGYDGRGVEVVHDASGLDALLDGPCLVEDKVEIRKELSVIAARRPNGQVEVFPAVEMVFHPRANLVEMLLSPAFLPPTLAVEAKQLAVETIQAFDLCGLLAVEMFLDPQDRLWINEVAPRPHNSGHHTLASTYTSQYEQHLRAIFDLPLGSTESKACAAMVNLLGSESGTGTPVYHGIDECLQIEGCTVHIYGKPETRPFRKMGHATLIGRDQAQVLEGAQYIQKHFKVTA